MQSIRNPYKSTLSTRVVMMKTHAHETAVYPILMKDQLKILYQGLTAIRKVFKRCKKDII